LMNNAAMEVQIRDIPLSKCLAAVLTLVHRISSVY